MEIDITSLIVNLIILILYLALISYTLCKVSLKYCIIIYKMINILM